MKYDPLYWGAVFPVGMYSVSTFQMAQAMGFDFLAGLPELFAWIALAVWALAFVAFLRSRRRALRQTDRP